MHAGSLSLCEGITILYFVSVFSYRVVVQVLTLMKMCSCGALPSLVLTRLPGKVKLVFVRKLFYFWMILFINDFSFFAWIWFCVFGSGGIFGLRLSFGENYPEKPPRVRFTSDVFHPNGKYCFCFGFIRSIWSFFGNLNLCNKWCGSVNLIKMERFLW